MNEDLKLFIEKEIIPRYTAFDKAHNIDHVRSVINESLNIAPYYNADANMCYTIAAYHDLGLAFGRDIHHIESGKILRADKRLKQWFTAEQIETMAEAAEDHRASSTHSPRSIYGIIVAEADRDLDPTLTIRRTIQYGLHKFPTLTKEETYERMLRHLKEKYAEGGYLRIYSPYSLNMSKLEELRAIINDTQRLRNIFEKIYQEETEVK